MTMSCVAEANATINAPTPTASGAVTGSRVPSQTIAAIRPSCVATSHARRRPSRLDSQGICSASTIGAHRNLIVYGRLASEMRPMVPTSTPRSDIHTRSVSAESASGNPAEKPSSNTTPTRTLA